MIKYTIKSTSSEGTYYLVNHWEKHRAFWVDIDHIKTSMYFNKPSDAKRSLTKLLKVMEDYKDDVFELIEVKVF
jgi:hypothetical protein